MRIKMLGNTMNNLHTQAEKDLFRTARNARYRGDDAMTYQSTSQALGTALVLNRADWLAEMRYTIAEALDRIGPDWAQAIPAVERALRNDAMHHAT